ncbi:MAG: lipopolysaccharide assembly protein LapA domain-containing protein [Thermodesulfobacteriota bacterium]
MRKIKYLFWFIIAAVLIVFVAQNQKFFLDQKLLQIDLYFFDYETPKLPVGIYYVAVFVIGLLISYFFSLTEKFRNKKIIRKQNEQIKANERQINDLKTRSGSEPAPDAGQAPAEPVQPEQSGKSPSA